MVSIHAVTLFLICSALPQAEASARAEPNPQPAIARGLGFLEKDALKWRAERTCATCHHGVMTLWAFSEAKQRGQEVRPELLADLAAWAKGQFLKPFNADQDLKPGFNVMPLAMVMISLAARPSLPGITPDELHEVATHLTERQVEDGSWRTSPPANAPVPVFESKEVMTLWAYLALERFVPADPKTQAPTRVSRDKAAAWLTRTEPGDTTQAMALRLLVDAQAGTGAERLQVARDRLLRRQNADGGWSQVKELGSDAFATGQALYALALAGVAADRPEVRRGVAFLVASQRPDGSWPMIPRTTPERKPSKNTMPIVHSGSAWATIGLLRSVPKR